jgi:hypothetical protein
VSQIHQPPRSDTSEPVIHYAVKVPVTEAACGQPAPGERWPATSEVRYVTCAACRLAMLANPRSPAR